MIVLRQPGEPRTATGRPPVPSLEQLAEALGLDALEWQEEALCAQTDPEVFFPEKGGSTREAKRICAACNVRVECLEFALNRDDRFGIYGGKSERERRQMKADRRASQAA